MYPREILPLVLANPLKLLIPMPSTHLRNAEYGRDFVNKSARLSQDLVCKISISPFFWSSWG